MAGVISISVGLVALSGRSLFIFSPFMMVCVVVPLRRINYPPHYQKPAAGLCCSFGLCQRLIIFWPVPNDAIRAQVGLHGLVLFQFLNPSDYLTAGHGFSIGELRQMTTPF